MYISLAITAAVLVLLWIIVRGRGAQVRDVTSAQKAIVPVDIEAFHNLIDAHQERFLRENLNHRDFRRVQRARYRAIAEYLAQVTANAAVMARLGEAARASHDPAVETQGAELASAAAMLRLYSLLALAQAYAGVLLPGVAVSVGAIADSYDRLTITVGAIGRAWAPSPSAR